MDLDKIDPRSQADKFRDLARELECDEDEARFDERVQRMVRAPLAQPKEEEG